MAPGKRKRNDRSSVDSGENRPSPHRPANTTLGQHDREADMRSGIGGGGRRSSRGVRGGRGGPRNERRNSTDPNRVPIPPRGPPGPMSPPTRTSSSAAHTQNQPPTTTPSPAPVEATPPPEPTRNPTPYDYSKVTDNRIAVWSAGGRQEVIAAGLQAINDVDILDLSFIFQELVRAVLDRRLEATDAGDCVKEILSGSSGQLTDVVDGAALFLDSLSVITETEPFDPALQKLVSATNISPVLMRQMLDGQLVQNLGLTRNTFIKAGIRQVTNILYRQANHNLLREESEGYSKLMTELFTTSGSEPPTSEVVEDTFERVKGLIGTFDLDVGRVLDVTLDVFASVLVKQCRFFIKFLRVSSWWPRETSLRGLTASGSFDSGLPKWALPGSVGWTTTAEDEEANIKQREERDTMFWERARDVGLDAFFELGGRNAVDAETREKLLAGRTEEDIPLNGDLQWIEKTGTMPPAGNRVAAQLLGFKLRFYESDARDKDDVLPPNLIYLAALLIKVGFISLKDLYPHLWPMDDDMAAVRDAKMKEMAEKERLNRPGGAAKNALMTAGALADDTLPNGGRTRDTIATKPDPTANAPASNENKDQESLPEPSDQKVLLLINLLTIGAIPESLFILGRFPWLPEAFPEIYDLLHRILHHSINKVYEACQVTGVPEMGFSGKKFADFDQASAPKGQVRRLEVVQRKPLRWPFPEKVDVNDGAVFRFYWDEWADNVPVCQNIDDVFTLCSTLLNISGVNIGRDASLLSKLATIGTKSLSQDHSDANLARWQDLLKRLLVPALSLTKSNTSVANELYDMLRYYPTAVRFAIYAEWFEGSTSRLPAITSAFTRARLETLSTMKRISMTNLTLMARTLAKTAYASPGVVFRVALDQIEAYSNLTEVVVECAKYFTDLGYDVLIWSLMSSLGKNRSRKRDDYALLTSRWLIALSKFSGKVFKRYSIMNPAPVLQYVNDQLYHGNLTDLIILEELIAQMSGIVPDTDFNDSQLLAMTGGDILRRQTLINLQDKRYESTKAAKRLMYSLTQSKLGGQLLISIAQHRQLHIYVVPEEEAHIKYLATIIDSTQRILVQYLDLLRSQLSVDQFDALVPSTPELMADYGLEPPFAFFLGRASYARRMKALQAPIIKESGKSEHMANGVAKEVDEEGDIGMKLEDSVPSLQPNTTIEVGGDVEMIGQADEEAEALSPTPTEDSWRVALQPLVEAVQIVLSETTWRLLSPEFYVIFWQLSLADITMPMESYTIETTRLSKEMSELMRDRSDLSRTGVIKKEEARKSLEATRDELLKESKQEMIRYERIRSRLNKEKVRWFVNIQKKWDLVSDALLEECFLPRLLLSPSDADYCFKFIKFLHSSGTPSFRTLSLYARIFRANRLRSTIFACTIREAENLGRFLKLILADLSKWHANKTIYEKEALGPNRDLPGFARAMGEDGKPLTLLEHEDFRRLVFKFHQSLNTALKSCLTGSEWMHIRNAITVLKTVVEHFPAVDFMGRSYLKTLLDIAEREKKTREDLTLVANALMPDLKRREPKWVMMQAFATNLGESGQQQNGVKANSSPQTDSASKSVLKPTAPEFKPQSRNLSNGSSTPKPVAGDVEDGEVDDAKVLASLRSAETSQAEKQSETAMSSNHPPAPEPDSIQTASAIAPPAASGTPSQSLPPAPPRIDVGRKPSPASVLETPHPGLPSRPDVSIPSHTDRHLPPRLGERRDLRSGRMDRSVDGPRDRPHDPYFDHRQELSLRDPNRPGDRPFPSDRERERHDPKRRALDPSRDIRDMRDSRDHRERVPLDKPRMPDARNGRLSRNEDMPPPRALEASQGATTNTDPPINPARAAQIFGASEPPRSEVARSGRDEHRDRPSSRPHSPRRDRYGALERDHPDSRRTEPIPPPPYMQDYAGGRHEDSSPRPMGPRSDRFGERGPSERARDSSAFQPAQPPPRPLDPDHGRLRSQPDPNYGRLNPTATSQIPSGPRDRNGRGAGGGNRMASAPQQRLEPIPQEPVRPPSPDKLPPTGPASFRPPRRAASGYDVPSSAPISAPTTPTIASSTASVHSDRLKLIGPAAVQEPPLTNASMTPSEGVHPSRLPAFQNDQHPHRPAPPALQTSNINPNSRPSSPLTAGPPSGPRGSQLTNNNAGSPSSFAPPTGPSGSNDRTRAPMRQLAGINSTLQQAGRGAGPDRGAERGTSIRGRGGRNSAVGSGSDLPPSPAPLTPTLPPPNRDGPGSGQGDRSRDVINPDRAPDLFGSRGANVPGTEDRNRDRADSRSGARGRDQAQQSSHREGGRSGRRSHRNSRSRSPGRDSDRDRERDRARAPMDESGRGEYRDRGRRQEERDMGRPSRDGDKGGRNGNGNGTGRDMLPRPPNEPEWGGVGGAGGGAGGGRRDLRPSGDNRRDSRGDGNGSSGGGGGSGRKRRGEVGDMGTEFRGNDKRPRTMR